MLTQLALVALVFATTAASSQPPSRRPVIGITSSINEENYEYHEQPVVMLPHSYAHRINSAGAAAVILPESDTADAEVIVSRLDGLVVAGGRDVDPSSYGEGLHHKTTDIRTSQDAWECALIDAARAAGLPLLAVCRGHQLLCVRCGGRLHQHLPEVPGLAHYPYGRWEAHQVCVETGSALSAILGSAGHHDVQVANHQGVADAGTLRVVARCADGVGIVQAVEDPAARALCLGVQWHPEHPASPQPRVFEALVESARSRAAERDARYG